MRLHKKRKVNADADASGYQLAMATSHRPDISHIVLASRAYSKDEEKQINRMFARLSSGQTVNGIVGGDIVTKYEVAADMTPFEGKDDVSLADRRSADLLKEIFRQHLP